MSAIILIMSCIIFLCLIPPLLFSHHHYQVVKVVAERSYGQDEAVVISYGLKSSAECLEDHGIVPDIELDEGEAGGITCGRDIEILFRCQLG